jgi:leader peptidase (prepilin peptidase)/N-methyltransferase
VFPSEAPPWAIVVAALAFGAVVGSFLNVCIYRLPRRESIVWPGSRCTSCGRALSWYENIPILSWALLGGRCRSCRAPVSAMYPIVEAVTALVFAGGYLLYGLTPLAFVRVAFACALIVLFVTDLQHKILPNVITVPGIVGGFVASLFLPPGWIDSLIGIAVGGGVLLAIAEGYYRIRGHEGLGMGDVKLLAMIGAFLGWKLVLLTLVFASFTGAALGLSMIATSRRDMKYALPFGTFLAVGAVLSAAWGTPVVDWYFGFY